MLADRCVTFIQHLSMKGRNKSPLLIFCLLIFACSQTDNFPKTDKSGTKIFYSVNEYADYWMKHKSEKVIIIDTFCLNQKKRALKDIDQNNLTYFSNVGYGREEFNQILKAYSIKSNSIDPHGGRQFGFVGCCYEHEMNEELERRYGINFFDSLITIAKKNFVKKHPNETFMENGQDMKDIY